MRPSGSTVDWSHGVGPLDLVRRDERAVYHRRVLEVGTTIDRYSIESPLGRGGMGQVYRAWDARLRRTIALKVLHESLARDGMMRLVREARLAASR